MGALLLAELGTICSNCDGFNAPGAAVCALCGKPLEQPAGAAPAAPVAAKPAPTPAPVPSVKPAPAPPQGFRPPAPPVPQRAVPPVPAARPTQPPGASRATTAPAPVAAPPAAAPPAPQPTTQPAKTIAFAPSAAPVAAPPAAPQAGTRTRVVVVRGSSPGMAFTLSGASVAAGRNKGLMLFPEDPFLASTHATFYFRDGKLFVRDEGSPSGTFFRITKPAILMPGAQFAAGDHLFRYNGLIPMPPPATPMSYGAPFPSGNVYGIEELLEGGRPGRAAARVGPVVAIGRSGCDLNFPNDPFLHGRHCEVVLDPVNATVRDLGSADGTFIRLSPGAEQGLNAGDVVRLGLQVLRVEM